MLHKYPTDPNGHGPGLADLFAYAGFLFDMLLALTAHLAEREPYALVAVGGLVIWGFAFAADRRRFGPATY